MKVHFGTFRINSIKSFLRNENSATTVCLWRVIWYNLGRDVSHCPHHLRQPYIPHLVRTTTQLTTFKAGDEGKTLHQHLFLPKDYSGSPTVSLYTPWTEAEVHDHLTAGWGQDAITDLKLEYLYGSEPEVSGE